MDKGYTVAELFDLGQTIAAGLFEGHEYPWEVLPLISDFITDLGERLDPERYERRGEDIWVARSARIFDSAYLGGPLIIDEEAEVRHCAFIRGSAIVGRGAVVGNSTELKNAVLFNGAQAPHYNYIGDSIMGFKAHTGAGVIASNLKSDKKNITFHAADGTAIETGLRKIGAILGDGADVGCGSVLNPGTVVGRGSRIYPLSSVRGFVPAGSIYKAVGEVARLEER